MDEWLYLRIYPGRASRLAAVVERIVPALLARASPRPGRWFFLRYVDQLGAHVRFRMQAPIEQVNATLRWAEQDLPSWLDAIVRTLARPEPRLLPFAAIDPGGFVGFDNALYEPEWDTYGGRDGVAAAEAFFTVSSELALVSLESRQPIAARTSLAVVLMRTALATIAPTQAAAAILLRGYAAYWLGPRGSADYLGRLQEAAAKRSELLAAEIQGVRGSFEAQIRRYSDDLARSLHAVPSTTDEIGLRCSQQIHLTNNRLGFAPEEESYLAMLALTVA